MKFRMEFTLADEHIVHGDEWYAEGISETIKNVADRVSDFNDYGVVRDCNGNKIGEFSIIREDDE